VKSGIADTGATLSAPITVEIENLPVPSFLSDRGKFEIRFNTALAEYVGSDFAQSQQSSNLAELETVLGTSLRSHITRVLATGSPTLIPDVVFSNSNGDVKRVSVSLTPCISREPGRRACLGMLLDSTREWRIEQEQNIAANELSIVSQVSSFLESSLDSEEIFKIVLIAVTAREGLGLNRAFLMLFNSDETELYGHRALGPIDAEEAGKIWGSIPDEGAALRSIVEQYRKHVHFEEVQIDRLVQQIRVPFDESRQRQCGIGDSPRAFVIRDESRLAELRECSGGLFGHIETAVAPMFAREHRIGVILADNVITGSAISDFEVEHLEMFANQATIAVERSRLYERLHAHSEQLRKANQDLEHTQREMVKIERLSLMGELTFKVAHELRNPLTIIGGFAALILKSGDLTGLSRDRAEIIRNECRRIEDQLDALLDFSKSYSSTKETVSIGSLAETATKMVRPKFTDRGAFVSVCRYAGDDSICAHKDQLLYGLFCVLDLLAEAAVPSADWTVSTITVDNKLRVEISTAAPQADIETAISLLKSFVDKGGDTGDIRQSLANEAIMLNGGELGFELQENRPIVYIEFKEDGEV
jgi:signal transduction histidine kinase